MAGEPTKLRNVLSNSSVVKSPATFPGRLSMAASPGMPTTNVISPYRIGVKVSKNPRTSFSNMADFSSEEEAPDEAVESDDEVKDASIFYKLGMVQSFDLRDRIVGLRNLYLDGYHGVAPMLAKTAAAWVVQTEAEFPGIFEAFIKSGGDIKKAYTAMPVSGDQAEVSKHPELTKQRPVITKGPQKPLTKKAEPTDPKAGAADTADASGAPAKGGWLSTMSPKTMKTLGKTWVFLRDNPFILPLAMGALGGGVGGMMGGGGMGALIPMLLGGAGGYFLQQWLPGFLANYIAKETGGDPKQIEARFKTIKPEEVESEVEALDAVRTQRQEAEKARIAAGEAPPVPGGAAPPVPKPGEASPVAPPVPGGAAPPVPKPGEATVGGAAQPAPKPGEATVAGRPAEPPKFTVPPAKTYVERGQPGYDEQAAAYAPIRAKLHSEAMAAYDARHPGVRVWDKARLETSGKTLAVTTLLHPKHIDFINAQPTKELRAEAALSDQVINSLPELYRPKPATMEELRNQIYTPIPQAAGVAPVPVPAAEASKPLVPPAAPVEAPKPPAVEVTQLPAPVPPTAPPVQPPVPPQAPVQSAAPEQLGNSEQPVGDNPLASIGDIGTRPSVKPPPAIEAFNAGRDALGA